MSNSPIRSAYEGNGPVRCDLLRRRERTNSPSSRNCATTCYTDYIVASVPLRRCSNKALSLATRLRVDSAALNWRCSKR